VVVRTDRPEILARYAFPPDRFQIEAFDALDDGRHVVVAAPTGSGKTVVAEYAIELARRAARGRSTRRRSRRCRTRSTATCASYGDGRRAPDRRQLDQR
jgi:Rad3-related DNA helicase